MMRLSRSPVWLGALVLLGVVVEPALASAQTPAVTWNRQPEWHIAATATFGTARVTDPTDVARKSAWSSGWTAGARFARFDRYRVGVVAGVTIGHKVITDLRGSQKTPMTSRMTVVQAPVLMRFDLQRFTGAAEPLHALAGASLGYRFHGSQRFNNSTTGFPNAMFLEFVLGGGWEFRRVLFEGLYALGVTTFTPAMGSAQNRYFRTFTVQVGYRVK